MMQAILSDLDSSAWLLSVVVFLVCVAILAVDIYQYREKLSIRTNGKWWILIILGVFTIGGGYETLANTSDAPHQTAVGSISSVTQVTQNEDRNLYLGHVLEKSGPSQLVNFGEDALRVIRTHPREQAYRIAYQEEPRGFDDEGRRRYYFEVIEMSDPETQELYYHLDTGHHPARVAVYLIDTLLLLLTGIVVGRLADLMPDPTEEPFFDGEGN